MNRVSYFRNFIFGVEDSLVSTVGLLSGIAIAGVPRNTVFLTGIILLFVEAFSMAAGSFLSESSAESFTNHSEKPAGNHSVAAMIMFFSYFISGFIPLFPYIILPLDPALKLSALLSVVSLFGLGLISAKISGVHMFKSGIRMALIGGIAIAVGAIAGTFLPKS